MRSRIITILLSTLLALMLTGCTSDRINPYDTRWNIEVGAPKHYDVWVTDFEFIAVDQRRWRHPAGLVRCCWKGDGGPRGAGGGVTPFPDYVLLRWFSFAEQKFYGAEIQLPDDLLEQMKEPVAYTRPNGEEVKKPRNTVVLGLAPGGEIVMWIRNHITTAKEVARFRSIPMTGEPSRYNTESYLERSGEYIEEHGVPTEGW